MQASQLLSQLSELDTQKFGVFKDLDLVQVSELDDPRPHSIFFAKDKKLLKKWSHIASEIRKSSLLITNEQALEGADQSLLEAQPIGLSSDVMLSLCQVSKVYFEQMQLEQNDIVDGRQLGTVQIDPTSDIAQHVFIGAHVKIGASVTIYPGCRILSHCEIADGVTLHPNVTLYPGTILGANSVIHAGSVIGADGFGYHFAGGVHHKIYHLGNVIIGRQVEIGANSCIDRATFGSTVVGDGSKIDNHVQVGHNCKLGRGVILCGHVALGGSTVLGDFTVFGGKSGSGHGLTLGRGVQVGGGGLVNCDWPDGSVITGFPARDAKEWLRGLAYIRKESLKKK